MPTQDTLPIKEKILKILKEKGPNIPIRIAGEIGQSSLFTSAFLSELLSEKRIKITNMKMGNSPIYYIEGTENLLENFSDYLKNKEKEAFLLLKEKKFLRDSEQEPAIRVALREIKDFAKPLEKNNELYWRYLNLSKEEVDSFIQESSEKLEKETNENNEDNLSRERDFSVSKKSDETKKERNPEVLEEKSSSKKTVKKNSKKKVSPKNTKNDKFFNKVKEFLNEKSIEITDIESVGKNELIFRVKSNEKQKLLFAFNKKRISEEDLIKANKKASELHLKYIILSLGEPLKRLTNLIDAVRNMSDIQKIN